MLLSYGFVMYGVYHFEIGSLYAHFLEGFFFFFFLNQKWVLGFVKNFFCIYQEDHMVFTLLFINVLIDLWILKILASWDKSHLITVYDLFTVLLDLVC